MEVWRGIEEGLQAVIVNPTIILGPGFWNRGSSSMFSRVEKGLRFATTGVTGFVGVEDVVSAMVRLMASEISGERFIISEGNYSFKEVFEMIAGTLGKPGKIKLIPPSVLRLLPRFDAMLGFFTGTRRITGEQAKAAYSKVFFSNKKILDAIGIQFTPMEEVIRKVAGIYRNTKLG
jgi:nucleoside-diphosphate-sugar epimerase